MNLLDMLKTHISEVYNTLSQGSVGDNLREDANKIRTGGMARLEQLANVSPQDAAMSFSNLGIAGATIPTKMVDAYKIFNVKANQPGKIFPMFIGAKKPTPIGEWIDAEFLPTNGYADRGGWHAGILPIAPHLMQKNGQMPPNRVWAKVSMPDDVDWNSKLAANGLKDLRGELPVGGTYDFKTNKMQGDAWKIGGGLRVDKVLSDEEVAAILAEHNLLPALPRDAAKSKAYKTLMDMLLENK
jgi:hypothetical protein